MITEYRSNLAIIIKIIIIIIFAYVSSIRKYNDELQIIEFKRNNSRLILTGDLIVLKEENTCAIGQMNSLGHFPYQG